MKRNFPKPPASGRPRTIPAPVGGWNARDSITSMQATDAALLENFFPMATTVKLRAGEVEHATDISSPVRTLVSYVSGSIQRLFAATDAGLFDVTSAGAVGAADVAITNGYCSSVNYSTVGGDYLAIANGTDDIQLFDGTTWKAINGTSTPAITGVSTSSLSYLAMFKRRLWAVEKDTLRLWYLDTGLIAGAATSFDVGPLVKRGGAVVACTSWTIDSGDGLDDYFVIATSEGELILYKGTDPSSYTTWEMVGLFYVGEPLNNRCFLKFGGELLFMCKIGVIPMSSIISGLADYTSANVAAKIQPAFNSALNNYGSYEGWMMCLYPTAGALILNVPIVSEARWDQYVQNTLTKAWTKFTGWNGYCMEVFGSVLYLGKGTSVTKIWTGYKDLGDKKISGKCVQAFSNMGAPALLKETTLMRPFLSVTGTFSIAIGIATDFNLNQSYNPQLVPLSAGSVWDTAVWDVDTWSYGELNYNQWFTPFGMPAQSIAVKMCIESNVSYVSWMATEMVLKVGGVL